MLPDIPHGEWPTDGQPPAESGCEGAVPFPEDPVLQAALDSCIRGTNSDDDPEERPAGQYGKSPETPETLLKRIWGYDGFRGIQRAIITSVLEGRDTLGLMPTGGGKSIAFQVPALLRGGLCIVVTPLISLMRDQVSHLRDKGIKATCVHTGMTHADILREYDNCILGHYRFLYLSPERLQSAPFLAKLPRMRVSLLTIDEAHCISQWGYDFRPSYLRIAELRKLLPGVPVLALTATATPQVAADIRRQLLFGPDGQTFQMSFVRRNLAYKVERLGEQSVEDKVGTLLQHLRTTEGSTIVYTRNRKQTEELAATLVSQGIPALYYHAGLLAVDRHERQKCWIEGRVRVMVATNAFGMGIDKPDVRHVFHIDVPDAIEEYFQEAGRAGRDGLPAEALLIVDRQDAARLLRHCTEEFPPKSVIAAVYEDLGSFFQLAVGDGENVAYDFDVYQFCRYFKYSLIMVETSLRILQYSGYLEYAEDEDYHSRLLFIVTRDSLYHEYSRSQLDDRVMMALLRKYTGLFADYVQIDEKMLAEMCQCKEQEVYEALLSLSRRRIVHYIPQKHTPTITYVRRRVDSRQLFIPPEAYERRMERKQECVERMIAYFTDDSVCRSRQLVSYFGETDGVADCGSCDVCLHRQAAHPHAGTAGEEVSGGVSGEGLQQRVLDILGDGAAHDLAELYLLPFKREEIADALLSLIERRRATLRGGHIVLTDVASL